MTLPGCTLRSSNGYDIGYVPFSVRRTNVGGFIVKEGRHSVEGDCADLGLVDSATVLFIAYPEKEWLGVSASTANFCQQSKI